MTNFPKFKEFHKNVFFRFKETNFDTLIKLTREFAEQHKDSLDGEMGLNFLAELLFYLNKFEEMEEILKKLENSKNDIIRYMAYKYFYHLYLGWFTSGLQEDMATINLENANNYLQKSKTLYYQIDFFDDWEKYYIRSHYLMAEIITEQNIEKKLNLMENLRLNSSKLPEYGHLYKSYTEIAFGLIFQQLGMFEEAKESFEFIIQLTGNTDISIFGYSNLANLSIFKGNLEEAQMYIGKGMEAVKGGNLYLQRMAYNTYAHISELNLNYIQSEDLRLKSIELSLKEGNLIEIFKENFHFFSFYIRMFNSSMNRDYLNKAIKVKEKLDKFSKDHKAAIIMERLSKFANALVMKSGGIRDRAKSIDLFEELMTYYPTNLNLKMNLVELYFEDLSIDMTGKTKEIIDSLMEDIEKSPLMSNPTTITEYSSYQILVAKYNYYLNGDIQKALDILYELKEQAEKFDLRQVISNVQNEINILESEVKKWSNINSTIRERIEKSNIGTYIQDLMIIAKRDAL